MQQRDTENADTEQKTPNANKYVKSLTLLVIMAQVKCYIQQCCHCIAKLTIA